MLTKVGQKGKHALCVGDGSVTFNLFLASPSI